MLVLFRNYEHHQRFSDAADLMVSIATQDPSDPDSSDDSMSDSSDLDIYRRMEYLSYAIHSGNVAVTHPSEDYSTTTAVLTFDLVATMNDQLAVASMSKIVCI